jgi:hypothetical protein
MNQKPKHKEKPRSHRKIEVQDLEPKKNPKGGVTIAPIVVTKPIDKGSGRLP